MNVFPKSSSSTKSSKGLNLEAASLCLLNPTTNFLDKKKKIFRSETAERRLERKSHVLEKKKNIPLGTAERRS
jgi:hypothetical protein